MGRHECDNLKSVKIRLHVYFSKCFRAFQRLACAHVQSAKLNVQNTLMDVYNFSQTSMTANQTHATTVESALILRTDIRAHARLDTQEQTAKLVSMSDVLVIN